MIVKISNLLFVFLFMPVDSQVCTKNVMAKATFVETYKRIVMQTYRTYEGRCRWKGCVLSRPRSVPATRVNTRTLLRKEKYCCDGYIKLENSTQNDDITCQPVCSPACVNGHCRAPGECACNGGFIPDPSNMRRCIPSCVECSHGECIAPNNCRCNHGYEMTNDTCQPICTDPCPNANCVAPETCECFAGYRKSAENNCEPYCSTGCENGTCIGPETCLCDPGYRMEETSAFTNSCRPVCDSCDHGTCVAPDSCSCHPGYTNSNGTCQPYCTDGCENGQCVEPEKCRCDPGYTMVSNPPKKPVCGPMCSQRCDYGTCVAPEVCQCNSGYIKSNDTCLPYCASGCENGVCAAPHTCVCNQGYKLNASNECEPLCSQPCGNGTCVGPDSCRCNEGYKWDSICRPECSACVHGRCVSPNVCECITGWAERNGTCQPVCSNNCGNGTCILPDVCQCFKGYQLDFVKMISGLAGPICMPKCVGCAGVCVAPNVCAPKVILRKSNSPSRTYSDDEDDDEGSGLTVSSLPEFSNNNTSNGSTTMSDTNIGITDSSYTPNGTDPTYDNTERVGETESMVLIWIEQNWWLIGFPVLLILLITAVALLVWKRKSLCHYFKGGSYAVEENNAATLQRTAPFVNVTFSDLEKKDKITQ